jgi:hypothetical protein
VEGDEIEEMDERESDFIILIVQVEGNRKVKQLEDSIQIFS